MLERPGNISTSGPSSFAFSLGLRDAVLLAGADGVGERRRGISRGRFRAHLEPRRSVNYAPTVPPMRTFVPESKHIFTYAYLYRTESISLYAKRIAHTHLHTSPALT